MKNTAKRAGLLAIATLVATIAAAADLNWEELARRPDLWPDQCTSTQPINLQGGRSIPSGQKFNVVRFKGPTIEVATPDGRTLFDLGPEGTDVLALARNFYASLTPAQRELNFEVLSGRKDLWPARVTMRRNLVLEGGVVLPQGDQLRVLTLSRAAVTVLEENLHRTFDFGPEVTDFVAQARKFLEDEHAGPRFTVANQHAEEIGQSAGAVLGALDGKLVNPVTGLAETLEAGPLRYIVFLRGSSKDPFTRGFTPTLVKYYSDMKPTHPEFEIIYLTADAPADTEKFARKTGMAWRTVPRDVVPTIPVVARALAGPTPQFLVMDRRGDVLIDGAQENALTALRHFDEVLRLPPMQN